MKLPPDSTVFVRGLPFSTTDQEVEMFFGELGPIRRCFTVKGKVHRDADNEVKNKGIAFIQFAIAADAQAAVEKFNNKPFGDRTIHVDFAAQHRPASAPPRVKLDKKGRAAAIVPGSVVKLDEVDDTAPFDDGKKKKQKKNKPKPPTTDNTPSKQTPPAPKQQDETAATAPAPTQTQHTAQQSMHQHKEKKSEKHHDATEATTKRTPKPETKTPKPETKTPKPETMTTNISATATSAMPETATTSTTATTSKKAKKAKATSAKTETATTATTATTSKKAKKAKATSAKTEGTTATATATAKQSKTKKSKATAASDKDHKTNKEEEVPAKDKPTYRSVTISNLPAGITERHIFKRVRKLGSVDNITLNASRIAHVTLSTPEDAEIVVERLNGHVFKGSTIVVMPCTGSKADAPPVHQLIVRNLAFQCCEKHLRKAFKPHGDVTAVSLPMREDTPANRGFGFVAFSTHEAAEKAIAALNGTMLCAREMFVDWAVSKTEFEKNKPTEPTDSDKATKSGDDDDDADDHASDSNEHHVPDGLNIYDISSDDDDDAAAGAADGEDDADSDAGVGGGNGNRDEDNADGADRAEKPSDVGEGRTVFIRNVPYNCSEQQLSDKFSEYGRVFMCKIVMDPVTQVPQGTAFVKFSSAAEANKCVKVAEQGLKEYEMLKESNSLIIGQAAASAFGTVGAGVRFQGRILLVNVAVDRKTASQLKIQNEADRNAKADRRNMRLRYEGVIREASEEGKKLNKIEIGMRAAAEKERSKKLANPNYFISPTRLALRNLPLDVTEKDLKRVFLSVVDAPPKTVYIKQAKIVRDKARVEASGQMRSRGFGFVEFEKHEHALQALRKVNNNPDHFGHNKRPIVEFALEDVRALQKHNLKVQRQQRKMKQSAERANATQYTGQQQTRGPKGKKSDKTSTNATTKQDRGEKRKRDEDGAADRTTNKKEEKQKKQRTTNDTDDAPKKSPKADKNNNKDNNKDNNISNKDNKNKNKNIKDDNKFKSELASSNLAKFGKTALAARPAINKNKKNQQQTKPTSKEKRKLEMKKYATLDADDKRFDEMVQRHRETRN